MSIAFMFSGQGAQYVGMGKELYDNFDIVKDTFEEANKHLGYSLSDIIFNDEEKLNNTLYTQLAIYTLEAAILKLLNSKGIESNETLGLSLGEYAAYLDSNVYSFTKGLDILSKRSVFMNEAAKANPGKMSAILNLDESILSNIINNEVKEYVVIANYNTYGQLVISGEEKGVLKVNELAINAGAKRAITLNTSGAFHSNMMKGAASKFGSYLVDIKLKEPQKDLLVNVTGDYYRSNIKDVMVDQITNSVMFYQMIESLIASGTNIFIEIGPKRTLSSFVKKINRKVKVLNVEDIQSFNNTIQYIKEN